MTSQMINKTPICALRRIELCAVCVFESESDEGFSGRWIRDAAAGT